MQYSCKNVEEGAMKQLYAQVPTPPFEGQASVANLRETPTE